MKKLRKFLERFILLIPLWGFSQMTVTGTVTEAGTGLPVPGVNVIVKGTVNGTTTDFDGNYIIETEEGAILAFSYIGFKSQEMVVSGSTLNVSMQEATEQLTEVVVIGYGTTTVKDATGSVDLVTTEDFNKGAIISTDQLLNGKAAGVRITSAGGSPDAAPNIRIRGGSSLNAQNNPLIVIDGVPIGQDNPAGVSNPLNLVNPNDIESFSILKDASATAIYGSRASNGVLIITTKKGTSSEVQFNFATDVSVSTPGAGLDMMNAREFTRFIREFYNGENGNVDVRHLLGAPVDGTRTNERLLETFTTEDGQLRAIYDTDWRDAVFRTALTSNTNFSARGKLFDKVPFRGSLGYTNAEGVVRTDDYERYSGSIKLTPRLFDDALKIDLNAKAIYAEKNAIDSGGALAGALVYDPTKPVYNNDPSNRFGGFYTNTTPGGDLDGFQQNPLALLLQRTRPEEVFRFLGNVELDYALPWVEGMGAVLNLGLDASSAKIEERFSENAVATFRNGAQVFNPGVNYREDQDILNTTLDFFLKYDRRFEKGFVQKIDAQAGYAYQNFETDGTKDEFFYNEDGMRQELVDAANPENRYFNVLNLQSFFGRTNIDFGGKYLLTLSFRADGSSLFTKDNRWGYFPAAALAWQMDEEAFIENLAFVNNLKLRLGWGQTGQQDITGAVGYFPSTPLFVPGSPTSQYLPGLTLYSANPFNPNLTWEKTTTYNAGLDFNLFHNGWMDGAVDVYYRETTDLLARVPLPPGQGLASSFVDNVGETESYGFEGNLTISPIQTEKTNLSINSNIAYNFVEIKDLGGADLIPSSGTLRGTGATLRYHGVGSQPNSAYVFKQVYDPNGEPIPNAFVDRNGDGQITFDDRYLVATVPNWTYGFGLNFNYGNWDLSASLRGQIGGKVYDFNQLNYGYTEGVLPVNNDVITNVLNFYDNAANSVFQNVNGNIQFSDYYLEDASFLRCDNIALGHRFDDMLKNGTVRFYGAVTNPFILTNYEGQDPENFDAIDRNFYPRPTVYSFGINVDF